MNSTMDEMDRILARQPKSAATPGPSAAPKH
jgi:hypothetical protein